MTKFLAKLIIVIVLVGGATGWYFFHGASAAGSNPGKTYYFKVTSGESVSQMASDLKSQGIIKSPTIFKYYAKFKSLDSKFIAGEHQLSGSMSIKEVALALTSKASVDQENVITIIEGWKISDMADYLSNQGIVKKADFLATAKTAKWKSQYDFLADAKGSTLEGYLFPDTYRIFKNATADDIVKKMLDNFDHKITAQMRQYIKSQKKSLFEIVTMASILEREAKSATDKKMVSDIFWKRITAGIALGSDATVNYVTGKSEMRPSTQDLANDSLYNTYKYRGLPPGPINNPGLDAITAAIYPTKNPYYYFINDLKTGQIYYGKTYDEHLQNVRKYLD